MNESKPTGFARLSLTEQANIIKSVTTLVATRSTARYRMELYELNPLFVELSFTKYREFKSIKEIKYINNSDDLKPYLDDIKLPVDYA
ncbi:MAG: hypothetical protein WBA23_13690 [Tunicatimonas sp.]|uniref:hypothetical protein n=1 Tax=Tunicatimonas sp. TaxID=1940096 RepID=UPI003C755994